MLLATREDDMYVRNKLNDGAYERVCTYLSIVAHLLELIKSQTASPHLKEEIINLCATTLPQYMGPTEIIIIETMPRTSRGKIDYRAVEQMVSGE